jgi:hypothetical protein
MGLRKRHGNGGKALFLRTLLLIGLTGLTAAMALEPTREPLKSRIEAGIEFTLNNQFSRAESLYVELMRENPRHPMGYFYVGATLQAQMLDAEEYHREQEFYRYMNRAIRLADSLKQIGQADAWVYFYEGSAYIYRSFMKSKRDSWFGAYRDAVRGVSRLEKALTLDSTLYDAYLGVGSYKYWKSAKVDWLPFVRDERAEGIQMVETAIEKGKFVHWVGRDQLCWILMNEHQYERALGIAQENLRNFPESRFFKWTLVEIAQRSGNYQLSYPLYQELLQDVRALPGNNHYNELECLVKLAEIDWQRKNYLQVQKWTSQALSLKLRDDIRKRARHKLKRLLELQRLAEGQLAHTTNTEEKEKKENRKE